MRKQLTIVMGEREANTAERGETTQCAIARTVNRQYPEYTHVRVNQSHIAMTDREEGMRYTWATPLSAAKFIRAFDRGLSPQPISFVLRRNEADVAPSGGTTAQRRAQRAYQIRYKERIKNETPEQREARLQVRREAKKAERSGAGGW